MMFVILFLSFGFSINALALSRRRLVRDVVFFTSASVLSHPRSAGAERGAAELDLEFYFRDLVSGNKKEGNILPSQGPIMPPPRMVTDPLRNLLLNNDFNVDCLTALALVEVVFLTNPSGPPLDPRRIEFEIEKSVHDYRDKAKRSFYARAPWKNEDVSDQYYFDLSSYAVWRTAADLLPKSRERDLFVRKLGHFVYENSLRFRLLTPTTRKRNLVGTAKQATEILELFKSNGFCSGYRIGEEIKSKEDQRFVFDDLDEKALLSGASVDCLVSIFNSATLGASLQITGEQSRFTPDYIGTTLSAMWEDAGFQTSWETYFVDPTYRPNPKGA